MKTKIIQLDGVTTGIAVALATNKKKFIKYKDKIRLFKNLNLAKTSCRDLASGDRLTYYVVKEDGVKIPLSSCYRTKHSFEYIDTKEDTRYIFRDETTLTATGLGYLIFEDGDIIRCDKKYGFRRQKELMNYIIDMASIMLSNNDKIISVEKKNYNHAILTMKNSTGQIHIVFNSKLMDINQGRKERGERSIPYIKKMDKFTTLYFYCIKDAFEPSRINSKGIMNDTIYQILDMLCENVPETSPKIQEIEFNGYVNIAEE